MYERIRALREDKDLTQREMGQILMCSQRIYSNYERGDVDIPTAVLIRLADFHGVSVDYLLNRTDNPKTNVQILSAYCFATIHLSLPCGKGRFLRLKGVSLAYNLF